MNPYEIALAQGAIAPGQEVLESGGYLYFSGGYVTPDGDVVYTGQAEPAPWYLTWFVGPWRWPF